ncbi:MAG: hypothetical protein HY368_01585, partial [Candidatus Aenigmarchaeota archaeon]|nr:hypothetical protein [Candidatus Aenigmarchaeota archaeon]
NKGYVFGNLEIDGTRLALNGSTDKLYVRLARRGSPDALYEAFFYVPLPREMEPADVSLGVFESAVVSAFRTGRTRQKTEAVTVSIGDIQYRLALSGNEIKLFTWQLDNGNRMESRMLPYRTLPEALEALFDGVTAPSSPSNPRTAARAGRR